jgi:hypothetical protein
VEVLGDGVDGGRGGEVLDVRAARDDAAAEEAVSGDIDVDPEELLADAQGVGVGDAEADVVAEGADVGDVVVQPFELEEDGPQPSGLVRDVGCGRFLDGEAVGESVADGGVAGDPLGELDTARPPSKVSSVAGQLTRAVQAPVMPSRPCHVARGVASAAWRAVLDRCATSPVYGHLVPPDRRYSSADAHREHHTGAPDTTSAATGLDGRPGRETVCETISLRRH